MVTVKAAQEVDGVGKVAAGVRAGGFKQAIDVGMARASFARNAGELRFCNTDRL
jgi:hypothetical protein